MVRLRRRSDKLPYGRVGNTSWSGKRSSTWDVSPRCYLYFWWEKLEFLEGWVDFHGGTQPHTLARIFQH
nr:MAG TPA: hypothetical protein [Caudoviricetes sp.]